MQDVMSLRTAPSECPRREENFTFAPLLTDTWMLARLPEISYGLLKQTAK
jgi:hypothetical protein